MQIFVLLKVGTAYSILSDAEKKDRYDRTGSIDDDDFEGHGMDEFMSMFEMMFGYIFKFKFPF